MRYEVFFKFFFADYQILDQASQYKKVVTKIWQKVGSLLTAMRGEIFTDRLTTLRWKPFKTPFVENCPT
jgi:hypothetical protein